MKAATIHKQEAFTRTELVVVIAIIAVVVAVLPSLFHHSAQGPKRASCLGNLKQIGIAYYNWAADHNNHFPAGESVTNGGWKEILTNADQGALTWTNYAIMANELGQSPKIVVCPLDERKSAGNFMAGPQSGIANPAFDNRTVSYFVVAGADTSEPQSLLAGDRNLGGGTEPEIDYGFSPESGQGNDVAIQTNGKTDPVCWSLKMHSPGHSGSAGNILLGDGSAQQISTLSFREHTQPTIGQTTNWPIGHTPSSPSARILFP